MGRIVSDTVELCRVIAHTKYFIAVVIARIPPAETLAAGLAAAGIAAAATSAISTESASLKWFLLTRSFRKYCVKIPNHFS